MAGGTRQTTLPDHGLFPALPLQTTPPTYLYHNDPPDTQPTLLFDPPIPSPPPRSTPEYEPPGRQVSLARWCPDLCPVCHRVDPNVAEHLLLDHPDVVNDRLDALAAAQDATTPDADPAPVAPAKGTAPAAFKTVPDERPGQPVGDFTDARACNDCGTIMSKSYARIFATEHGDLWCPDCRSRSERYSNEGGRTHGTDPATVTGADNPNAAANTPPSWRAPDGGR